MLQAILFDLGDTLFDFAPVDTRAVFRLGALATYDYLAKRGCQLPDFAHYWKAQFSAIKWAYAWAWLRRREFNSLHLLKKLCNRLGAPDDDATLRQLAWLSYSPLIDHTTVADEVIPTLSALQHHGLKLALVSNTFVPAAVLDHHLEITGLLPFFPVRIYSGEIGYRKPDKRIFQMALNQLGTSAQQSVFVGDMPKTDILGARRMGMTTLLRRRPAGRPPTGRPSGGRSPLAWGGPSGDYAIEQISEILDLLPQLGLNKTASPLQAPVEAALLA